MSAQLVDRAPVTSELVATVAGDDVRAWIAYPPALTRPGSRRGALRHPLHRHRAASPETAPYILEHALDRPDLLPRYLPEGRGKAYRHVGVHVDAPAGAYSRIPVWGSREHWLAFTVPVAIALHRDVLARHRVSPAALLRWARAKSGYAWDNGRRCVVKPATLASVISLSKRQTQRLNNAARELGLEVVVLPGRMLELEERMLAQKVGSRQRGLATETALTIPPDQRGLVDHVTPSGGRPGRRKTHDFCTPSRPTGRMIGGRCAAAPTKKRRRGSPAWLLARDVVHNVAWLAAEAPSRLIGALTRFVTCPEPWTGRDVAAALAARDRRLQQPSMTTAHVKTRPAAVLAAALRDLDPVLDHPALHEGPLVPIPATSCGHPSCDGHGWLNGLADINGYQVAIKCPRCHASVRANPRV